MPCYVEPPSYNYDGHIKQMLCKACCHLTLEQMFSIQSSDNIYGNLLDYYFGHLQKDIEHADNPEEREKAMQLLIKRQKEWETYNREKYGYSEQRGKYTCHFSPKYNCALSDIDKGKE